MSRFLDQIRKARKARERAARRATEGPGASSDKDEKLLVPEEGDEKPSTPEIAHTPDSVFPEEIAEGHVRQKDLPDEPAGQDADLYPSRLDKGLKRPRTEPVETDVTEQDLVPPEMAEPKGPKPKKPEPETEPDLVPGEMSQPRPSKPIPEPEPGPDLVPGEIGDPKPPTPPEPEPKPERDLVPEEMANAKPPQPEEPEPEPDLDLVPGEMADPKPPTPPEPEPKPEPDLVPEGMADPKPPQPEEPEPEPGPDLVPGEIGDPKPAKPLEPEIDLDLVPEEVSRPRPPKPASEPGPDLVPGEIAEPKPPEPEVEAKAVPDLVPGEIAEIEKAEEPAPPIEPLVPDEIVDRPPPVMEPAPATPSPNISESAPPPPDMPAEPVAAGPDKEVLADAPTESYSAVPELPEPTVEPVRQTHADSEEPPAMPTEPTDEEVPSAPTTPEEESPQPDLLLAKPETHETIPVPEVVSDLMGQALDTDEKTVTTPPGENTGLEDEDLFPDELSERQGSGHTKHTLFNRLTHRKKHDMNETVFPSDEIEAGVNPPKPRRRRRRRKGEVQAPGPARDADFVNRIALVSPRPDKRILSFYDPQDHVCEEYRLLGKNLLHTFATSPGNMSQGKVVALSSSARGEGKTLTSVNLAMTLSQDLKDRILLVDGDLRHPKVHRYMGVENRSDFNDMLMSSDPASILEDCILRTETGLHLLMSSPFGSNPAPLLDTANTSAVFDLLRDRYSIIIVDTPPVLLATDALTLGVKSDGMLFLLRARKTQREQVQEARQRIARLDIHLLGYVINNVRSFLPQIWRKYYYGNY